MVSYTGSKDRLDRAKTIDLCQNPLTVRFLDFIRLYSHSETSICLQKEPKLSRARQIPEWEAYDKEIEDFARELAERGAIGRANGKGALEDVRVLAGSVNVAGSAKVTGDSAQPEALEQAQRAHGTPHTKDEL
jgi:UDP-glucose:glycoprotein glucosyltransferase